MKTKPKPKPSTRSTFTPLPLVKQLAKDVPGFKSETLEVQAALAALVWIGATKRRQHNVYDGYMSFHYKELAHAFGGKWNEINQRLSFLEMKDTGERLPWRFNAKGGTATDVHTKAYRFSLTVQASRDKYLAKRETHRLTRLVDMNGTGIATPPNAVSSLDTNGKPTSRWRLLNNGDSMSLVPVNIASLKLWEKKFDKDIATWQATGKPPQDLFMQYATLEILIELRDKTKQIRRMAHTDVAGLGNVMHVYKESPSGRLYTLGGASLQNAPKELRKAALVGLWDYDLSNCHFAIIANMARAAGYQCVAIEHYMANKKALRAEIANAIGISIDQTKTCLLAVMYGARKSTWHENAIPETVGVDAAKRLNDFPLFANIVADVKLAGAAILAHNKPNRQGGLVNVFGKSMPVQEKDGAKVKTKAWSKLLAHLIQGVEAKAIRACLEIDPGAVVLIQHDGFTATKQLNVATLEKAILDATGYTLTLEEDLIQPDIQRQFDKSIQNELLKVQKALKTNTGAGFRSFRHHQSIVSSEGAVLVCRS
uniref:hypothetical protein n=1 Tax=Polaromonas sp. W9N TaxID=1840323 RepID=UPI0015E7E9EA|nr:hypothetical protein [Polaromonas sp. W9N]